MYSVETINYLLSLATLVLQILTAALLALFLLRRKFPDLEGNNAFIGTWGIWIAFFLSLFGFAAIVVYEMLGFAGCFWCWVQRIFLFPQIILFAIALWKKDRGIADYSIALSCLGGLSALYQHYLQMGGTSVLPCPATSAEALDCGVRFVFEFGYITFPLMAFTLFAFLITLMLFVRKARV